MTNSTSCHTTTQCLTYNYATTWTTACRVTQQHNAYHVNTPQNDQLLAMSHNNAMLSLSLRHNLTNYTPCQTTTERLTRLYAAKWTLCHATCNRLINTSIIRIHYQFHTMAPFNTITHFPVYAPVITTTTHFPTSCYIAESLHQHYV